MTATAWMLLAWVVVFAALLVVHAVVLWQGMRAGELEMKWRWFALLPPAAPVVAWLNGARVAPVMWGVFLSTYVVLRAVGG